VRGAVAHVGLAPVALELRRVVEQREQPARDRVARGLAAREREHVEEQRELEVGEARRTSALFVGQLGAREDAPHVVARIRALARGERDAVLEDLALEHLLLLRRDRHLRIARDHVAVDPLEHIGAVRLGDPDDVGDHVHRERVGGIVHELALAALEQARDDRPRPRADLLFEPADHARREAAVDQPAQAPVRAAVGGDQRDALPVSTEAAQRRALDRGEGLLVARDAADQVHRGDRPEAGLADRLAHARRVGMAPDRGLAAQPREQRVREARAVERAVREIDAVQGHAASILLSTVGPCRARTGARMIRPWTSRSRRARSRAAERSWWARAAGSDARAPSACCRTARA
jgi:hypothetical protein